ncbi:MAG: hypothetical protein KDC68_06570 [Gelidibacter sp.]|nr:hypothetical protein [Gelidibacter sp.]
MLIKYFTNQTKDVATGYILNSNAVASELFPDFFSVDLTDVPGMAGLVQQWDNAIDSRRIATL